MRTKTPRFQRNLGVVCGAQGARVELIPLLDHLLLATLPAAA